MGERYTFLLCGLGLGLGIGLVAGLLFAPQSGARTRSYLIHTGRKGTRFLEKQTADIRKEIADTIERGKHAVAGTFQSAAEALSA